MNPTVVLVFALLAQLAAIVFSQSCSGTTVRFTNETTSGSSTCAVGTVAMNGRCVELTEVFAALPGKECSTDSECGNPNTWVRCFANRCDLVQRAEGDACRSDGQCSGGATCIGNVCTRKKSGEGCNTITSPCTRGFFCGDTSGNVAVSGTCQARKGSGDKCNTLSDIFGQCADGLYCSGGACVPRRSAGQACDTAAVCENSVPFLCVNSVCTVSFSKSQGSQCTISDECGEGLFCINNQCQPKSPESSCNCPSKSGINSCHCNADGLSSCAVSSGCAASLTRMLSCITRNACSLLAYDFDTLNCKQKHCRAEILSYYGCIGSGYVSLYPNDPKKRLGAMPGYNSANQSFVGVIALLVVLLAHLF